MALDTRDKRASVLGASLLFLAVLPNPDSSINQADRQQVAGTYCGVLAQAGAPPAAELGFNDISGTNWTGYSTVYCANHDTSNSYGGDTIRFYIYCRNTSNSDGALAVGLYSDDAGYNRPQDRLATAQISVPKNSSAAWRYADITYTLSPNTKYWLAQIRTAYIEGLDVLYKADVNYRHAYYSGTAPLPDPWSDATSNNTSRWSMYITYGSEAGGSSIPVKYHHFRMMRG